MNVRIKMIRTVDVRLSFISLRLTPCVILNSTSPLRFVEHKVFAAQLPSGVPTQISRGNFEDISIAEFQAEQTDLWRK